jgi:nitronate monooxygenase
MSSATTVREAIWLDENGADIIIAQGAEAGGHRGMFLTDNIAQQPGTLALVPQVVDAVKVPVIAAGGIADGRGIAAAFALGAAGVQIGTAYLRCPESKVSAVARAALGEARDDSTVITNVMTGRPARGVANRVMREVGPIFSDAPAFPHAKTALVSLRQAAEELGRVDFSNLWAGQAVQNGAGNAGRRADPGARSQRPGADEPVAGVKSRQRLAVAAQNRPLLYRRLNLPFEANAI